MHEVDVASDQFPKGRLGTSVRVLCEQLSAFCHFRSKAPQRPKTEQIILRFLWAAISENQPLVRSSGLQPAPIAHLNPIRPAHRKLPQELVQVGDEVPAMLVVMSCLRGAFSAGHSAGGRNRPNRGPGL
jgi:hypothetical protein